MLREITQFLRLTGMPESTFGRKVANDPRLVYDIRNGRQPREKLQTKILDFISNYRGDL